MEAFEYLAHSYSIAYYSVQPTIQDLTNECLEPQIALEEWKQCSLKSNDLVAEIRDICDVELFEASTPE